MAPIGGNAASSSFEVDQFDTPSGGGGGAAGASSHTPGVTYQWEKSDNGGAVWNQLGWNSASYTTGLTTYADDHNDQYRCVISAVGAASDATTNAVTLTVLRTFQITQQPVNATANESSTAQFSVTTSSSSGTVTYQWERSDDGGANYTPVTGATNASYTTPTLVFANDNADRYRVVASLVGSAADITSTHGELTVLRVISIQTQPNSTELLKVTLQHLLLLHLLLVIQYHNGRNQQIVEQLVNINGANGSIYYSCNSLSDKSCRTIPLCIDKSNAIP